MSSSSINKSSRFDFPSTFVFSGSKSTVISRTLSFFYHFFSLPLNLPFRIEYQYLSIPLSFFSRHFQFPLDFEPLVLHIKTHLFSTDIAY